MRIALAQIISSADLAANLELVADYTKRAAAEGAELVIFPEATMRCFGRSLTDIAEPLDGPWAERVRVIAAEHQITVVAGMFTPGEGDRVRNTMLITGPSVEASYDKIHLFDAFGFAESDTVTPGTAPLVIKIGEAAVGVATCYDIRFPGLFIAMAEHGAQLICLPASWGAGPGKVDQWQTLTRARAMDSTTFIAACGQGDPATEGIEPKGSAPTGIGHSAVIGPLGDVRANLDAAADLLVIDLDLADIESARQKLPVLANRRF